MANTEEQWEFADVQNLVRHRKSGRFYGRFRIGDKRKFISLQTDKKTIARLRLTEKTREILEQRAANTEVATS